MVEYTTTNNKQHTKMALEKLNDYITYLRKEATPADPAQRGFTRNEVYALAKAGKYGLTIRDIYQNILKGPSNRVLESGKNTGLYMPSIVDDEIIAACPKLRRAAAKRAPQHEEIEIEVTPEEELVIEVTPETDAS